ncbi:MAG: sensor histidine kinase [Acidimicrobiia bacterium]
MTFRPTVRLRLTLAYGGLFLLAGAVLLGLNYLLVRNSLLARDEGSLGLKFVAPAAGSTGTFDRFVVGAPGFPVEPVTVEGKSVSEVITDLREQFRDDTLDDLVWKSVQALGAMAIGSVGLGWLLAGRVLQPLHDMTAKARRLSGENLHERIALPGPDDELKELADTFDELLGRLEAAFDSQKRFVANASHELRTPLAIIRTEVDVTLGDPDASAEDLRRMAGVVGEATRRSEALIDALLLLARSDRGLAETGPVDLAEVTADVVATFAGEAAAAGIEVSTDLEAAPATGDAALLVRLTGNLIQNALRHNRSGGRVIVSTGAGPTGAFLRVGNTGEPIEAGEVDALFEPFVRRGRARTGGPDTGIGLGLSIVRSVATAHGGRVSAHPRSGGGLDVEVVIPGPPPL